MNRCLSLILVAIVLQVASGCSQSDSQLDASTDSGPQAQSGVPAANQPSIANQPHLNEITQVVKNFWEAVRTGQDANALLTPAAQKCIADNDYEFAPPASENARYKISGAELIEADKAIVESIWTDIDGDGQPHDNFITIALKLVEGGWRVSGMAADLGPDQPPFVMNLEDPAEFYGPQTVASPPQPEQRVRQAREPSSDPFQQPAVR